MIYKQLEKLCFMHNTTPTAFVKDILGLSSSKVTAWKNGSIPKYEILLKIANYFDVSIGYLFDGEKKSSQPDLTEEEYKCLEVFNRLEPEDRIRFIAKMEQRYEDYSCEFSEELTPETKENVS